MKYNFDEKIDRSTDKCRKWDYDLIKLNFGLEKDVIPMDIADMDFACAPAIVDAIVKRAQIPDYGYTYAYNDYYDAIIDWNKRRHNIEYQIDWIKLMFGTNGALRYIIQCFCEPGSSVMINTPVYAPFAEAVFDADCKLICNALKVNEGLLGFDPRDIDYSEETTKFHGQEVRYYLDFDLIEKQIEENNVSAYILCSPHNPGGRIWSKEELYKLCDICIKHNVLLISDEVHCEMCIRDKEFITLWNAHPQISDHSIVCKSLNKAFNLGGLKSSYMIIKNPDIRTKMLKYLSRVYITSPHVFVIPATIAAYNESEDWLNQATKYIEDNFNYCYSWLSKNCPAVKTMRSDASYLAWMYVGDVFSSENDLKSFMKQSNITAVYGSYFVDNADGWIRLNLGTQRANIKEALNRILINAQEQKLI